MQPDTIVLDGRSNKRENSQQSEDCELNNITDLIQMQYSKRNQPKKDRPNRQSLRKKKQQKQQKQKLSVRSILLITGVLMLVVLLGYILIQYFKLQHKVEQLMQIKGQSAKFEELKKKIAKLQQQNDLLKQKKIISEEKQIKIEKEEIQNIDQSLIQNTFDIPKIVWVYLDREISTQNYITQRTFENIKYYTEQSHFQFRIVNRQNYATWLKESVAKDVRDSITKASANPENRNIQSIQQQIIMLFLLRQNGGVIINHKYMMVEKLDWLRTIHESIVVNKGDASAKPKYFGFHHLDFGPHWEKAEKNTTIQIQKLMIIYPGLVNYFFAGLPQQEFIVNLVKQFVQFVSANTVTKNQVIQANSVYLGALRPNDNSHTFAISIQIILQKKQKQLDKGKGAGKRTYAIDVFGLRTINCYYYPEKMWVLFKNRLRTRNYFDNFFNLAGKLPQNQFQQIIGPIRYIINPDPYNGQFNHRLEGMAKGNNGYTILESSLFQRHLFPNKKEAYIIQNKEKYNVQTNFKVWQNLPKKLWLYWDSGIQNSSAGNQLCVFNMIKHAKEAQFQVILVSDNNLKDYLPLQQITKIQSTLKSSQMTIDKQTKSDFVRVALIAKHGGIYMDASYYWTESFKWILEVAKEPAHLFYNRFGEVPKVLMQFHCLEGAPFDWKIDQKFNTKASWHLALQNNLIIAEKDSQLMKQWYDMFIWFATHPFHETQQKMIQCNTNNYRWTEPHNRYLTAMDSLKAVIGCRQKSIENEKAKYGQMAHAGDYYKLWSFNGFTGLQKFRYYNDYAFSYNIDGFINNDPQGTYILSTKYNDEVIGKVYKGIKMYSWNVHFLNIFLMNNRGNNFATEAHPNSYFMKYLYNQTEHQFYSTDKLHAKMKI